MFFGQRFAAARTASDGDGYSFGGCNSLASQRAVTGEVIGSTLSQSKQAGRRGSLPLGCGTNASGLPHRAQFKVLGSSLIA